MPTVYGGTTADVAVSAFGVPQGSFPIPITTDRAGTTAAPSRMVDLNGTAIGNVVTTMGNGGIVFVDPVDSLASYFVGGLEIRPNPSIVISAEAQSRIGGDSGHVAAAHPHAQYTRKILPNTFYAAGEPATNAGLWYTAKVDFTTGSGGFVATDWTAAATPPAAVPSALQYLNSARATGTPGFHPPLWASGQTNLAMVAGTIYGDLYYSGDGQGIDLLDEWLVTGVAGATVRCGVYVAPADSPFATNAAWALLQEADATVAATTSGSKLAAAFGTAAVVPAGRMFAIVAKTEASGVVVTGSTLTFGFTPLGHAASSTRAAFRDQGYNSLAWPGAASGALPSSLTYTPGVRAAIGPGISFRKAS